MSLLINVKAYLDTVKAECSIYKTLVTQYLGQTVQGHYLVLEFIAGKFLLTALLLTLYDGLHLLISKTSVAANHCPGYAGTLYHTGISHLNYHGVRELVFILTQRAEVVAEFLGQHRYGAIHQID